MWDFLYALLLMWHHDGCILVINVDANCIYLIRVAIEVVVMVLVIEKSTRCNGSAAWRFHILLFIISMCNHASYLHALHWNTKWLRSNGHTWVRILCFSCSWSFSWRCPCQNVFLYIVECDDRLIGVLHWVLAILGNSMHLGLFGLESKRGYRNQSQEMHFIDSVVESFSPKAM